MDRITGANYIESGGKRVFTEGPPATTVPADWLTAIQEEIMAVIDDAGISPSSIDKTQLLQAIQNKIYNNFRYAVATGAVNTLAITTTPAFTALTAGMQFVVQVNVTNTGAATLNVNSLGAVAIKKYGGVALSASDLLSGAVVTFEYDGTNFQLLNPANSLQITDGTKIIRYKTIYVTGWNMDTTISVTTAHGLSGDKIIAVSCTIKTSAAATSGYDLMLEGAPAGATDTNGIQWTATDISLARFTGGPFDSATFNNAAIQILITYTD